MFTELTGEQPSFLIPEEELTALRSRVAALEREIADLKWTNSAINALASCAGAMEGREFLQALVRHLSDILKVSHVLVTELVPGRTDRVRVMAGWACGRPIDPLEYDLSSTPCEIVLKEGSAFFPEGAWRLFARDTYLAQHHIESYMGETLFGRDGRATGHLCIMDQRPFVFDHPQGRAIVKVFAERAGAELERLHADEIIRQREERLRTLYEDNPSMYFTLSPEGLVISVNRYGAAQLGYTVDELVGRSVLTIFDAADRETVLAQLRQCAAHPFRAFTWEIQKIRKDGSRLWVHERARAIVSGDGGLTILIVCEDVTEHRKTSQLLSTLIRESPLPIVSLDQAARVTSWNPAATKLFGWTEDEVLGKELPYVPPGEEQAADLLWEAGMRGELNGPIELRRQRKDGTPIDLLLWPVYVRDENGLPTTGVGLYVDQSDLKRAKAEKLTSDLRLRAFLDALDDIAFEFDRDGTYLNVWTRNEEILLLPKQETIGKRLSDIINKADAERYVQIIRQVLATGHSQSVEYSLVIGGRVRHFSALLSRIPTVDHAHATVACVVRETTARKQAELALQESESRLHRFIDDAPVGLIMTDEDARILHVNRAFCHLIDHEAQEIIGQSSMLYIHPEDVGEWLRLVSLFVKGEQASSTFLEQRYIRKNSDIIWVSVKATRVQLPNRDQPLLLAAVQDITEQRKSERLLATEKEILELIAGDAPLSSVLETICTMVETAAPHLLCSIVFLDARHHCLRPGPAPSLPPEYVALADGVSIGPSVGSCGTAAYTGQPVIVVDIATDPLWAGWKDIPLAHGLRSCWSMPIKSPAGQVLGSFAIYSRTPRYPTAWDRTLMERIAHLAGIAMTRARAREEREQLSQDLHDNILQSLYAIGMQLEASRLSLARSPKKSQAHTALAIDQLNRLVGDVRQYIAFLKHPSAPATDFGQALRQLVASFSAAGETAPDLDIQESLMNLITPEQGEHLLNIAREALSNSARHSGATHRSVRVSRVGA
ncbi:MAG: PAS domain S-box protein, partial [Nitrospira sp.]|nr:PAS domain S-box protein [Nitrospira sp.]